MLLVGRFACPGIVTISAAASPRKNGEAMSRRASSRTSRAEECAPGSSRPVRRAVDGVDQAEPPRLGVHEQHEAGDGILRQRPVELARRLGRRGLRRRLLHRGVREHDGRVVGRVHDQRGQQRPHALALAELQRHGRLAHGDRVGPGDLDRVEARVAQREVRRHELRERRDLAPRVGRVLHQHTAVTGRLDDPGRGLRLRRRPASAPWTRNEQDEQGDGRDRTGRALRVCAAEGAYSHAR